MQTFMKLGNTTRLVGSVSRVFVKQRSPCHPLHGDFKVCVLLRPWCPPGALIGCLKKAITIS